MIAPGRGKGWKKGSRDRWKTRFSDFTAGPLLEAASDIHSRPSPTVQIAQDEHSHQNHSISATGVPCPDLSEKGVGISDM